LGGICPVSCLRSLSWGSRGGPIRQRPIHRRRCRPYRDVAVLNPERGADVVIYCFTEIPLAGWIRRSPLSLASVSGPPHIYKDHPGVEPRTRGVVNTQRNTELSGPAPSAHLCISLPLLGQGLSASQYCTVNLVVHVITTIVVFTRGLLRVG